MKFISSTIVAYLLVGLTNADTNLRGAAQLRKLADDEAASAITYPAPVSNPECTAIGQEPYLTNEYVVFQWNMTTPTGEYLPDDYWAMDCTDKSDQSILKDAFQTAYNTAVGDCAQYGAFHQVSRVNIGNCNPDEGTFYLHIETYSNAAKERASALPESNNCGVVVYNDTAEVLDSVWDYDIVGDIQKGGARRRLQDEDVKCDCPGPKASDLIVQYNSALVAAIDMPEFSTYINETQQLCIPPPDIESTVSSEAPSSAPTKKDSRRPTSRPTPRPTPKPTPNTKPTRSPTLPPTPGPTSTPVPTFVDVTQGPTTTQAPNCVDDDSCDTTASPTSDTNGDETPEPTVQTTDDSPVEAPVEPTEAPVDAPVEAPVEPTEAPFEAPADAPVEPTDDAPVDAPEEAPVVAPEAAPVEAPEAAPVEAPEAAPVEAPEEQPEDDGGDDGGDDGSGDDGGDDGGGDDGGDDGSGGDGGDDGSGDDGGDGGSGDDGGGDDGGDDGGGSEE